MSRADFCFCNIIDWINPFFWESVHLWKKTLIMCVFGHSSGFFFDTFFPHWKTNSFNGSMILNNNDPSMIRLKGERNEIKILLKTIVINFFSSLWSIQFIYKVSGQPPTFNNNKKQFIPVNLHRKQRRVDLKFSVDEKIIDKEQNEKKKSGR